MHNHVSLHGLFKLVMVLISAPDTSFFYRKDNRCEHGKEIRYYHLSDPSLAGGLELPRHESLGSSLLEDRHPAPPDGA